MLTVEHWPVDRLTPYVRNPRKNDKAIERMCAAIREFGFRIPVVARSDGTVVDDWAALLDSFAQQSR